MKKSLFIFFIFIISCCCEKPIVITSVINSCVPPSKIDYFSYNDIEYNSKIEKLTQSWPEDVKNYLTIKMQNRIIQHERCKAHVEEHISYENCILSIIDDNSYAKINN